MDEEFILLALLAVGIGYMVLTTKDNKPEEVPPEEIEEDKATPAEEAETAFRIVAHQVDAAILENELGGPSERKSNLGTRIGKMINDYETGEGEFSSQMKSNERAEIVSKLKGLHGKLHGSLTINWPHVPEWDKDKSMSTAFNVAPPTLSIPEVPETRTELIDLAAERVAVDIAHAGFTGINVSSVKEFNRHATEEAVSIAHGASAFNVAPQAHSVALDHSDARAAEKAGQEAGMAETGGGPPDESKPHPVPPVSDPVMNKEVFKDKTFGPVELGATKGVQENKVRANEPDITKESLVKNDAEAKQNESPAKPFVQLEPLRADNITSPAKRKRSEDDPPAPDPKAARVIETVKVYKSNQTLLAFNEWMNEDERTKLGKQQEGIILDAIDFVKQQIQTPSSWVGLEAKFNAEIDILVKAFEKNDFAQTQIHELQTAFKNRSGLEVFAFKNTVPKAKGQRKSRREKIDDETEHNRSTREQKIMDLRKKARQDVLTKTKQKKPVLPSNLFQSDAGIQAIITKAYTDQKAEFDKLWRNKKPAMLVKSFYARVSSKVNMGAELNLVIDDAVHEFKKRDIAQIAKRMGVDKDALFARYVKQGGQMIKAVYKGSKVGLKDKEDLGRPGGEV